MVIHRITRTQAYRYVLSFSGATYSGTQALEAARCQVIPRRLGSMDLESEPIPRPLLPCFLAPPYLSTTVLDTSQPKLGRDRDKASKQNRDMTATRSERVDRVESKPNAERERKTKASQPVFFVLCRKLSES